MAGKKTVIVTGASQGIGAAIVHVFLDRGYNVVGNSRRFSDSNFSQSPSLALVEGDIGLSATAEKIAQTAIEKFGSIDHVVCNAGIFSVKPFTDYTADDFRSLSPLTLKGSSTSLNLRSGKSFRRALAAA
jgi:NAD(P)-dependent dehydrogenase (short-subunit alcohol dehydrogenase family)